MFYINLEEFLFNSSHFWGLGKTQWARILIPLAALPFVGMGRLIYPLSPDVFYLFSFLVFSFLIFVTFLGFNSMPIEKNEQVTSCKILGMMLAMMFVPIKIGNIAVCLLLFHVTHRVAKQHIQKMEVTDLLSLASIGEITENSKTTLVEISSCLLSGLASSLIFSILHLTSLVF